MLYVYFCFHTLFLKIKSEDEKLSNGKVEICHQQYDIR